MTGELGEKCFSDDQSEKKVPLVKCPHICELWSLTFQPAELIDSCGHLEQESSLCLLLPVYLEDMCALVSDEYYVYPKLHIHIHHWMPQFMLLRSQWALAYSWNVQHTYHQYVTNIYIKQAVHTYPHSLWPGFESQPGHTYMIEHAYLGDGD